MTSMNRLAGATAIVTAGGEGIGEAVAKTLAREGAFVAVADINLPQAQRVCAEIQATGAAAIAIEADVMRSQDVAAMVKAVLAQRGEIDILVNVAGGWTRHAPLPAIPEEDWDRVIDLNMKTAFLCVQAVAPSMMEKKKGRIISIASAAGVAPISHVSCYLPYGAAKAGLIGLTKHLAKDLAPYGITVNTVAPGTTLTPRVKKARSPADIERIISQNPMKCLVEPEDAAEAVLFLAAPESRYITGINICVNAGTLIV
jgi:NAD(P)-dependent dehydrogenase (short-subunit alcohol dehydrogenase family)